MSKAVSVLFAATVFELVSTIYMDKAGLLEASALSAACAFYAALLRLQPLPARAGDLDRTPCEAVVMALSVGHRLPQREQKLAKFTGSPRSFWHRLPELQTGRSNRAHHVLDERAPHAPKFKVMKCLH